MRTGVIGCGEIGQIMHLPYLAEIPDVDLHALVDLSPDRVERLGERYGVRHRFTDPDELLADVGDALDAAVVLTPPQTHADVAVRTLDAGVHTLVEKPLAVSLSDADRIVDAADRSSATAMVGYNKRYAPAYEATVETVAGLDAVDRVTAYATDPDHARIIEEVYDLVGGSVPDSVVEESRAKRERDAMAAVGTDDRDLAADYDWHLEHVCHDVNALRGLFGDVEAVDHVDRYADGRYATAHLRYGDGLRCTLHSGVADRKFFEEFVRVDYPEGVVELSFDNPYVRNSPPELRHRRGVEELTDETRVPSYEESFKRELEAFLACARGEREVRTTVEEARADVRLVADLFRALAGSDLRGADS